MSKPKSDWRCPAVTNRLGAIAITYCNAVVPRRGARCARHLRKSGCGCRAPKTSVDCAYCGCGGDGIQVCGRCHDSGIDGPVIRSTSGRRCVKHAKAPGRPSRRWR